MKMIRIIKVLILLLCSNVLMSQRTKCIKKVPYLFGIPSEKLSYRLTKDYYSDYQKVLAIHNWITHNIKYDIKKADRFDYTHYPVKKILNQRKATCVGYSDLFNELCKHAGILSTSIQGYTNNIDVDVNDKFYLDDHAWNAVYIDGKWLLIDVCWDAGYVRRYNRGLWGHIVFGVTFGQVSLVRYKPKFIFDPRANYFCKSGSEFQYDHIPLIPIWQLTDPTLPIDFFERDSSFYFRVQNKFTNDENNKDLNRERVRIAKMEAKELALYQGPIAHDYNKKNYLIKAISESIEGIEAAKNIVSNSRDTSEVLKHCNSALTILNQSRASFDSTLLNLSIQKTELNKRSQTKNEIFNKENNLLSKSRSNTSMKMNSEIRYCKLTTDKINRINERNYDNIKKLSEMNMERESKVGSNAEQDSFKIISNLSLLYDSIETLNKNLSYNFNKLDSFNVVYKSRFSEFIDFNKSKINISEACIDYRMEYIDDLDFEIRRLRDSSMNLLPEMDSSLYADGIYVTRSFGNEVNKQDELLKKLNETHKALSVGIARQFKNSKNKNSLYEDYQQNFYNFNNSSVSYSRHLNRVYSLVIEFYNMCQIQESLCKMEKKLLEKERKIERQMFSIRRNYINRYYAVHVALISKERTEVVNLINHIVKLKKKYSK